MGLKWYAGGAIVLLTIAAAFADEAADRAKLIGTWQLQNGGTPASSVWKLEDKGDDLRISLTQAEQGSSTFECNTLGRECEVKDGSRKAKISMWFSGPKLVELETKGSEVLKRRFNITGQGDSMEVEIIPVVPPGKPEVLHFKRTEIAAQSK